MEIKLLQRGLADRLTCLHDEMRTDPSLYGLARIAVAVYDETSDEIKTFIHSSIGGSPVDHSTARLSDVPMLQQLAWTGARRIVNNLSEKVTGPGIASKLVSAGYHSSYTVPIQYKGTFYGFLFFNAFEPNFFSAPVLARLRPYAELVSMMVMREMDSIHMLQATIRIVRSVSSARDEETGTHLARMARYARLIASKLAAKKGLSDEFVEFIFQFAPLHDIGKVAVPDSILFKPGKLDPEEFEIMKSHVTKGVEIIDRIVSDCGLRSLPHYDTLWNIVAYHHETLDGKGYPYGIGGDDLPMEARIASVADVFDALTSARPYKKAWTNEAAFELLSAHAGTKFDPDCVEVMLASHDEIVDIQSKFVETEFE